MPSLKWFVLVAVGLFLLCVFPASRRTSASGETHPGAESYVPTKIDWLELQARLEIKEDSWDMQSRSGMMIDVSGKDSETLVIFLTYLPNTSRVLINRKMDNCKKRVHKIAQLYKWDDWLKVEENIEMAEPPK
jgi:hypothetical protein